MALIYCVEDDNGIRELITCALQSGGYTVEGFPNGRDFFTGCKRSCPLWCCWTSCCPIWTAMRF